MLLTMNIRLKTKRTRIYFRMYREQTQAVLVNIIVFPFHTHPEQDFHSNPYKFEIFIRRASYVLFYWQG